MTNAPQTMRRWLARTEGTAALAGASFAVLATTAGVLAVDAAAGVSALCGALDVMVFFGLGAVISLLLVRHADASGMLIVMAGYFLRMGLLTAGAAWLTTRPWLGSLPWLAAGIIGTVCAWVAGMFIGHANSHLPLYDVEVVTNL